MVEQEKKQQHQVSVGLTFLPPAADHKADLLGSYPSRDRIGHLSPRSTSSVHNSAPNLGNFKVHKLDFQVFDDVYARNWIYKANRSKFVEFQSTQA